MILVSLIYFFFFFLLIHSTGEKIKAILKELFQLVGTYDEQTKSYYRVS